MKRPCPICKKPADSDVSPDFPFCSERCRLLDLGNWATGRYVISEPISGENELGYRPGNRPPDAAKRDQSTEAGDESKD